MSDLANTKMVRCHDRTVFRVHPETLEPQTTAVYDAYCFADPLPHVDYINYQDWLIEINKRRTANDRGSKSALEGTP